MNKRILSIILAVMLCITCWIPTFAITDLEMVDVFNKTIWNTNFDNFAVGTYTADCKDANGTVYLPRYYNTVSQIAASPVDVANHGNAMKLISGTDSSIAQINSNKAFVSGKTETVWKIQQDFLFESTSSHLEYRHLNELSSGNIHNTLFNVTASGVLSLPAAATNTTNFDTYKNLSKNTWYTFTIIIDSVTDKYSMYINGDEITKNASLTTAIPKFESIHMRFGKATSQAGFCGVYIDNFSCHVQAPFTFEKASIEDNQENCSLINPVIFTYSGNLSEVPTVTMTKEGEPFYGFDADIDNNFLTVSFDSPLDRLTTYGIKVENIKDEYQSVIPLTEINFTTTDGLTDLERVDKYNKKIWNTNFDNFAVDTDTTDCKDANGNAYLPKYYNTVSQIAVSPVDASNHGNAMKLISGTDSSLAQINSNSAFTSTTSQSVWKIQQDFLFESTSSELEYRHLNEGDENIHNTLFKVSTAGVLTLPIAATNTDNYNTYKNLSKNTWYTFTTIINSDNDTYSLYINNVEITKDAPLTNDIEKVDKVHIRFGKASTEAGFCGVYIDNFSGSVEGNFELEEISVKDNETDCSLLQPVTFTYSRTLRRLPAVTMTENGQLFSDFVASNVNNMLVVSFDNPLERLATYTITVANAEDMFGNNLNEAEVTFKTTGIFKASEPIFIDGTSIVDQLPSTGTVEVVSDFVNGAESIITATLVAALYDENDGLIDLLPSTVEVLDTGDQSIGVTVSVPVDSYSNLSYIKAFVVDTLANLEAHDAKYSVLGKEETVIESKKQAQVTITQFSQRENTGKDYYYISGTISPALQKTVLVSVADSVGNIWNIMPVTTTEEGTFELSLPVTAVEDTEIVIKANGAGITNSIAKPAMFVGTSRIGILNAVNTATTKEEVETDLAMCITKMAGTDSNLTTGSFCDNGYQTLLENKPFTKFCDVIEIVAKAEKLLYRLNNDNSSYYEEILTNNHSIVLKGYETDYDKYAALTGEEKGQVATDVIELGSVSSFEEFRVNFSNVMSTAQSGNAGSGGGNGGESGGFTPPVTYVGESGDNNKSESPITGTVFTDLENYSWAKESIEALCVRGVVNGDGNGNFRPEASVTREEFIKMLVTAFDITLKDTTINFNDVEKNAWYTPYIKAAYAFGITTGQGDSKFGIGDKISRQDMAVMCARVLEKKGYKISETSELTFKDSDGIAVYAKEAVSKIKGIGVINGTDSGEFLPLNSAKRAEAAKIIYGLLIYCEEAK